MAPSSVSQIVQRKVHHGGRERVRPRDDQRARLAQIRRALRLNERMAISMVASAGLNALEQAVGEARMALRGNETANTA